MCGTLLFFAYGLFVIRGYYYSVLWGKCFSFAISDWASVSLVFTCN